MKYLLSIILLLVLTTLPRTVENKGFIDMMNYDEIIEYKQKLFNIDQYIQFKEHLGFRESSNRYRAIRNHYWGRYQMGKFARRELQINLDRSSFLSDTLAQEIAVFELMEQNKDYLSSEFETFIGDTINGIPITYAGLLASSHLVGYFSVKNYLHSNGRIVRLDGNNVSLELYLEEFSEYEFELNDNIKRFINKTYGE